MSFETRGYSLIALVYERVTVWLQCARLLPCVCVFATLYACAIRNGYTRASHANNSTYAHAQGREWLYASLTRKAL